MISDPNHLKEYFGPWEKRVTSFSGFMEVLDNTFRNSSSTFVWRGVASADHALHSSLYRRLAWASKDWPRESDLRRAEGKILADAHRWGLHTDSNYGRLSILRQLALLQHYGAPTRLIDVSLNAFIALWFAVEKGDGDGRIYAFDASDRIINESRDWRPWEDVLARPWPRPAARGRRKPGAEEQWNVQRELAVWGGAMPTSNDWMSQYWVWIPSGHEPRIRSQHGAFIFGGVPTPSTGLGRKGTASDLGTWRIDRVLEATSLPIRLHQFREKGGRGRPADRPCYTMRIDAVAKPQIRERLNALFGYSKQTLFPDYPGFAEHAIDLPLRPPGTVGGV